MISDELIEITLYITYQTLRYTRYFKHIEEFIYHIIQPLVDEKNYTRLTENVVAMKVEQDEMPISMV